MKNATAMNTADVTMLISELYEKAAELGELKYNTGVTGARQFAAGYVLQELSSQIARLTPKPKAQVIEALRRSLMYTNQSVERELKSDL